MSAYPQYQPELSSRGHLQPRNQPRLAALPGPAVDAAVPGAAISSGAIDQLLNALVERIAAAVAERLGQSHNDEEWFDCRHAADYLGVHRDTLRKLAAERAIPAEQDGPGCRLYFRRADLDAWRRSGGRPRHLQAKLASVA